MSDTNLLSPQVVSVMHVLVFAQVSSDLSDLCVELYIIVFLLAKHDGILQHNYICKSISRGGRQCDT